MTIGGIAVRARRSVRDRSARGKTGARSRRRHRHAPAVAASHRIRRGNWPRPAASPVISRPSGSPPASPSPAVSTPRSRRSSSGDKTMAQDVRVAIDLTGQRAEVRETAADLLGGRLAATGGAPLVWLNQWLPAGWQFAQPQIDAPATLEGKASFDVAALLDVFGRTPMEALGGGIDLSAKLTSSRPDLMAIAGDVRLDRAEVTAKELTYAQSDVTRLRLSDGALTIESLDWRGPGSKVIGRGSVGLAKGVEHDVRLDVDTELGIIGALVVRPRDRPARRKRRAPRPLRRVAPHRGRVADRCLLAGARSAHSLCGLVRPHSLDGRRSVADEARRDGQWRHHPHRRPAATRSPGRRWRPDDRRARHPDRRAARAAQPARRRLGLAAIGGGRDAAGEGRDHRPTGTPNR